MACGEVKNEQPASPRQKKVTQLITVKMYKRKSSADLGGFVEFSVLVSTVTMLQLFDLLSCKNHLACHSPHTGTKLVA